MKIWRNSSCPKYALIVSSTNVESFSLFQNLKNQIMTTNLWVEQVRQFQIINKVYFTLFWMSSDLVFIISNGKVCIFSVKTYSNLHMQRGLHLNLQKKHWCQWKMKICSATLIVLLYLGDLILKFQKYYS